MTATLGFERPDATPVAEVPLSAIFQRGTQPAVWVVNRDSGTVELRPVTIARWRDDTAAILSGVKEGELIATAGVHKLETGQKVKPLRRSNRRPARRLLPRRLRSKGRRSMTTRTNLSALALKYSTLTVFFMIALTLAGVYAFFNLGRAEDPPFTIKQMVVSAAWPGATRARSSSRSQRRSRPSCRSSPTFSTYRATPSPARR